MHNPDNLLFVVNPVAGGKAADVSRAALAEAIKEKGQPAVFFACTGKDDKAAINKRIDELKPTKVIAVGGDGTVKMVAEIVKESTIALGIIPAGSANGLARELGIPTAVNEALDVVLNGQEGKLDAIRINEEELCFHLSDAGLNALLVKYFERYEGRGMWGYARSLFKMLWNKRRMRVRIETDDGTVKRKAFMVALANAERYGTGAVINPNGKVNDGLFEVVVVRNIHLLEVLKAVTAHKGFNPKHIEVLRTTNAKLTFQQKAPFQVDGEYQGKTANLEARILPGVVRVMLPSSSPPKEDT